MRTVSLIAAVVLTACSDPATTTTPDAPADAVDAPDPMDAVATVVSGTRLRARYLVAADDPSARTFAGWHDAQLDVDCVWTLGDAPRCLPSHGETYVYTDAACTAPVFQKYPGDAYTHVITADACGREGPLYVVGSAISPSTVYDSDGIGGCTPRAASGQYFQLTLDPAPYVTGTIVDAGVHRARARTVHGADGSIWPFTAFDAELDAVCSLFGIGSAAPTFCLPRHIPSMFTEDSSCTQPVAFPSAACPLPSFVYLAGANPRLFRRGEIALTGPATFVGFSRAGTPAAQTCTPYTRTLGDSQIVVRGAAEVSLADLPPVTSEQTPTGRLASKRLIVGAYAQEDGFYDVPIGKACTVQELGTNAYRCLPPTGYVLRNFFWTDATCTTRRVVVATGEDPPIVALDSDSAHLFALGAQIDPATLYAGTPGACEPYASPGGRYYDVGSEIGLDTFVEFTPRTE